jgi:UDP-galactopyranose mutase
MNEVRSNTKDVLKILVVGAGFSGTVVARQLAEAGHKIHVIDKRDHLAGNAYDYVNNIGLRVHKYGPHIFHTSNEKVVAWLSRFTDWVEYKHKVKALLSDGQYVTLPINSKTIEVVGRDNLMETLIRPYTFKMWGKNPEELDPSILQRLPIRDDLNEFYFPTDSFQAMPTSGYTKAIEKALDHENITILLNTRFEKKMESEFHHVFNSMPIDEYFEFKNSELPYRSVKFQHFDLPVPKLLPVAQVNFTHAGPFTRMTEWKHFPNHGENPYYTSLTTEEPCDYKDNNFERYYPVKDIDGHNRKNYMRYLAECPRNMTFIGRCGLYAYLDMHQAISTSLSVAADFLQDH